MHERVALVLVSMIAIVFVGTVSAQKEAESPLLMSIKIVSVRSSGDRFTARVNLTNRSRESIAIDLQSLHYGQIWSYEYGVITSVGEGGKCDHCDYYVVKPGERFEATEEFPIKPSLPDYDGEYRIRLVYGQFADEVFEGINVWKGSVKSNEVVFIVRGKRIIEVVTRP